MRKHFSREQMPAINLQIWRQVKAIFLVQTFSLLFYYGSIVALSARPQNIVFETLTLDRGLSQCTVASIIQDQDGFLWFGTIDGLNRFDGYNFTVYQNNPNDSNSIADNWITSLCMGNDGTLWIGTLSRGLCKYDSRTGKFTNYRFNPIPIDSPLRERSLSELPFTFSFLNYYTIKSIFEDSFGSLWIGTFGAGLYKFNKDSGEFIHYPYNFEQRNDLAYNIMSIDETIQQGTSTLWFGTFGGGLIKFVETEGFRFYKNDTKKINSLSDNRILTVYSDTSSEKDFVWIGTSGGGLNKFDPTTEEFTHFKNDPQNTNSLSSNYVTSILRDRCHELWIGTLNTGLNRFEVDNNRFTCYQHDPVNINSLANNEVLSLFEDRTGILWIGTNFGHGINKVNRKKNKFTHYSHHPSDPNSLSENVIYSLFEDRQGVLWIGTFQSGLNRFDRKKNEFTNYRHDPKDPNSISDNHIRSIFEDSRGKLWIGTFSGGLNYFNQEKDRFFHYRNDPQKPKSLSTDQIRSIYEDQFGNLWISTFGGGLDKFDRVTGNFIHYCHDPADSNSISDNYIYFITGDKSGSLWIATFRGGINKFDIQTEAFTRYRHDPDDENSLCEDRILTIYIDEQDENVIWIGSFGKGLDKLVLSSGSIESYTVTHYTQEDGLPNEVVYSILPDNGNLWLSTNKGISKFNPSTETFINYDLLDGLQSNEFNAGAYYKSRRTGEMFFGGVNGFNCFHPEKIEISQNVPPVVITSFRVFDEEICDQIGPIFKGKEIQLTHKENFFAVEFAVLDYTNVTKNQFAYKLQGLDDGWIDCGNRNYMNYTNLDPGEYTFRVKGSNCDGVWNEEGTYVKFKIKPRFYQTRYWHPTVVGTLVLLIIIFFAWRTRSRIKRSIELERVRNQEKERVQKTIAADFHDELGQKLTKISLFSEIVKAKLSKESPEYVHYIKKINKSAKELASSTRDFIWTLNPKQDSLHDIIIYLKDSGDELFDKTGIEFRVGGISKNLEKIILPMEWRRHLILIFKEAMNNAIKHAECTSLTLAIALNHHKLEMSLSDNGIGCLNGQVHGGQGLNNMKHRAELIHGDLDIVFDKGNGTTIRFTGEIPQMGY
jgi:two-component system sensor histidine kinase ChiS